jgi:hypothetical protein
LPNSVEVELDIFSGNPNPTWLLSDRDAAEFVTRLGSLWRIASGRISNPLGYRGFVVETGRSQLVRVQNGTVQVTQGEDRSYFADPRRDLERWLFSTGQTVIDSGLAAVVEAELGR